MKSNDWRHKNVARYTPGNTKILYFFNCLLDGMHTTYKENVTGNRDFSTMDMFPTTLAALGVQIDGNRLGLGTNLFSGQKTLPEKLGRGYINQELKKNDKEYNGFY